MAKSSSVEAILKSEMFLSDKDALNDIAEERIVQLTTELGEQDQDQEKECDPIVEMIKDGKYLDYHQPLAEEQQPKFLVFGCSDSGVSPSFILDFKPGEAFVPSNIASIIPAFNQSRNSGVGAVIESAVRDVYVKNMLVIGHSRIGGIKALMPLPSDGTTSNDFIDDWVKISFPARAKVEAEWPDATFEEKWAYRETESVNLSLLNLLKYPCVRKAMTNGTLKLMGGYYDSVKGNFNLWKADFEVQPPIII